MDIKDNRLNELQLALQEAKEFSLKRLEDLNSIIDIYTHLDADGLVSGAILGKLFYREKIPFRIRVLRQLEKEEIEKIIAHFTEYKNFTVFSDFGSGQYLELESKFNKVNGNDCFLIIDHHLPQGIENKENISKIEEIKKSTSPWHVNPYFFSIDGSIEISAAGMCYLFAKCFNEKNIDLSGIALVGAIGDIQNRGKFNTFLGINKVILEDAIKANLIEVINDLNFSSIKPLNEAIAYASSINLPGLSGNASTTLKFLKRSGVLMEKPDGTIKTLNDLTQEEKQKISSLIVEYCTLKLNVNPKNIMDNLIINRFILKNEEEGTELSDLNEFSNILNACGRSNNGALGIAIAMGDRKFAFEKARKQLKEYKKLILKALSWIQENNKIQQGENIQYFFGEDIIPESIIGTIASMLSFEKNSIIDKEKPIIGLARRQDENVYKISARASNDLVKKGVNLSEAIRSALKESGIEALGGGHPPAAGTKIPINSVETFLKNLDEIIKNQLNKNESI